MALDLDQAGRMFSRVLDLNGEYVKEADGRVEAGAEDPAGEAGDRNGEKDCAGRTNQPRGCGGPLHGGAEDRRPYAQKDAEELRIPPSRSGKAKQTTVGRTSAADISTHPLRADIEGLSGSSCAARRSIRTGLPAG